MKRKTPAKLKSPSSVLRLVAWAGCIAVTLTGVGGRARSDDWPMWRFDAARTGASREELPSGLHLQWTRKLPPPLVAWPNEPRLHFDASYEPVVMGKTLFLGSPNDGSVSAFDTETGRERWRFYTEGPVRFAPVAWKGRIYAGSDDGHLYCLDAARGRLLWKRRGAPDERPGRRHLGNARLISFWPVRGGPVLADGTIYFAAGIWPTMGVFIVAVDAETGRPVWVNRKANFIEKVRIDHNILHEGGLSPQGYLVIEGDALLIPNGRSMPAGLDRRTGKLLYYVQGYRNGDCRVIAEGKYAFVGRTGVLDIRTGREVGSRWLQAGKDAPNTFVTSKFHLFEGPIFPYKMFPGCSARSVLKGGIAFGSERGVFYAYDLNRATVSEYDKEHAGHKLKPWRWDAPALWKLTTEYARKRPASMALIKAGNRLYGHAGRTLIAIELPAAGGRPKIAWKKDIDGTPSSVLAADGKLFVVTREGGILCFGGRRASPKPLPGRREPLRKVTSYPLELVPLRERRDEWARTAAEILKHTKVREGYCLVLGLRTGRLPEELLRQSELKIIGVDADRDRVDRLRAKLAAAGVYGSRAEVFVGKPFDFPFPPYLASLIVSEDLGRAGPSTRIPVKKLFDILRPYGGAACLTMSAGRRDAFMRSAARFKNADVTRAGNFVLLRRVGALPGAAYWTHETADAARSFFSRDERVKTPLGVLWYGDGPGHGFWKRKDYGIGVKPQVAGGRLFAFQIGTRTLFAYDVYTGRVLWKRKVDAFTRYASMEDGVYVAGGDSCIVHDPATAEPLKTFRYRAGDLTVTALVVADIRVADDVIVIAAAPRKVRVIEKGLWDSTTLVALDRKSGRQLWTKQAKDRFNNNAIAVGGGMVFCIDSVSPIETEEAKRRGEKPDSLPSTVMALDARSGRTRWTAVTMNPYRTYGAGGWTSIRANDDWLAYCEKHGLLLAGKHGRARAYDARTGREAWQRRIGSQPLILLGETFLQQGGALFDTRSGKPLGKKGLFQRGGCNYAVGSPHLVFLRDRSVCYVQTDSGRRSYLRAIRSGCSNSLIAADGLLNCPNFAAGCVCNYPMQTAFALVHMPEVETWAGRAPIKLGE